MSLSQRIPYSQAASWHTLVLAADPLLFHAENNLPKDFFLVVLPLTQCLSPSSLGRAWARARMTRLVLPTVQCPACAQQFSGTEIRRELIIET
jgi:hypothetical protein